MRLALALGRTLGQLGDEMPANELPYWVAFEQLEGPIGLARGDIQAGVVAAVIANQWRGKDTKPASPVDFVPDWEGAEKQARKERTAKAWRALAVKLKAEQEVKALLEQTQQQQAQPSEKGG